MKKIFVSLAFFVAFVNLICAQKWELGVDAGLFRNTGSNVAEGSGANFPVSGTLMHRFTRLQIIMLAFS